MGASALEDATAGGAGAVLRKQLVALGIYPVTKC